MNKIKETFKEYVFNSEKVKNDILKNEYKEKYLMRKRTVFAGTLIVAILVFVGYVGFMKINGVNKEIENTSSVEPFSYLTISINPEVELGLDENDNVVEVIPINSDADVLTSDLDLVGLTVEEASEQIIDSAMESGYLDEYSDENTIVVTTVNDNDEKRELLQEKVIARMNAHFETRKIYPILVAKGLADELKAEADSYGISYGKMLLVERAIALDSTLSKDELVTMSVKDVQDKVRSYVKERHNELNETIQEARENWVEQKQQLKQQYIEKVEQLKATISDEQKEEFNNMTKEQKEEAIRNYLNARKELIKSDINSLMEEIKAEVKEDMEGYNYPILENNANTIKENIRERIIERRINR